MGDRQDSAGSDVDYRWRAKIIGVAAKLARLEWLDDYGVDLDADPRTEQMRLAAIALREGVESVCLELDAQDATIATLREEVEALSRALADLNAGALELEAEVERLRLDRIALARAAEAVFSDSGWCPCCDSHRHLDTAPCLAERVLIDAGDLPDRDPLKEEDEGNG